MLTIFCVVFLGIVCRKKNIFSKSQIEGFELLLFKIIMPSYLFSVCYTHNLALIFNVQYITAYLVTFGILAIIVAFVLCKRAPISVILIRVLASGYVNAAIYTLPITTILLKDSASAIIGNMTQVILIQPIFIACLNISKHKEKSLISKIVHTISTPLIIMPIIGIGLNYLHLSLPGYIIDAITQIGNGSPGIALFAFGLTLGATKITKESLNLDLMTVIFAKNVLHPLIALCVAYAMKLEGYWIYSLVIASSAPTAFVVYIISKQFCIEEELVNNSVALSSVISVVFLVFIVIFFGLNHSV